MLGDTPAEAEDHARHIRRQQVSPQTAILMLEQVWNTDLSSFDAEGPLPPFDPDPESPSIIQGRARMYDDPVAVARKWRALAEERHLSIRDLIIEVTGRQTFIGDAGLGRRRRSTAACRTTRATGSSWCRT